jgi:UDP:flavonoid glycosyltransferase YjiC (YdhE family)
LVFFTLNLQPDVSVCAIKDDDYLILLLLQDLKAFLDGAEHGVIIFSLGSSVRAETFPPEKRDAFIQAFSELPQKVLWKWEGDTLPGQPTNVKIVEWIPQMDVLGNYKYSNLRIHAVSKLSLRTDSILCNTLAC